MGWDGFLEISGTVASLPAGGRLNASYPVLRAKEAASGITVMKRAEDASLSMSLSSDVSDSSLLSAKHSQEISGSFLSYPPGHQPH